MSQFTSVGGAVSNRRRSQRVLLPVPIVVQSVKGTQQSFEEETETVAVNAHGALILLTATLASGQKVMLRHKKTQEEKECKVVWLGPTKNGRTEVGLEFTSPSPRFWRVNFPPEDWTPRHPDARSRG